MKLHKRYPLNRLSAINTTTLLLLMGCAGVGRKPTEAPIEFDATPTSVDGYLAHLEYDENAAFEANQELYDVDIVDGPADITFSLEIEDEDQPTDANNGFLLKSYASFAPFIGGTDAVEFYEIDNLPANVDLL